MFAAAAAGEAFSDAAAFDKIARSDSIAPMDFERVHEGLHADIEVPSMFGWGWAGASKASRLAA